MKSRLLTTIIFIALILGLGVVFGLNQISNELADPDAFYHMRMAQLMAEQGIIKDFIWLPYTTLGENFANQHLVFHALMIPFVAWMNPFVGIKIYTIILALTMLVVLAVTLKKLRLPSWWLVTSVLALTIPFTFRLNLVKATPLSLILVLLAIICLFYKKNRWLLLISTIFVWTYGGFAILLLVVGIWSLAELLEGESLAKLTSIDFWKKFFKPIAIVLIGFSIGLVVNPFFPNNLYFYWDQLVQIGIINYQDTIGVGSEWSPYHPGNLFIGSTLLTVLVVISLSLLFIKRIKFKQLDWFALGIFILGLLLVLKSRRYVEYFGPFTALAVAIWLRHSWIKLKELFCLLTNQWPGILVYVVLTGLLVFSFTPVILNDIEINQRDVRSGTDVTKYQAACEWIKQNATPNSKILHSDWDDFPMLFYHNSNNAYMAGLDPTFMYRYDKDLYNLWVDLTLGNYTGDVELALQTLDVEYIIIETNHTSMYHLINKSDKTKLVYSDEDADVFKFIR